MVGVCAKHQFTVCPFLISGPVSLSLVLVPQEPLDQSGSIKAVTKLYGPKQQHFPLHFRFLPNLEQKNNGVIHFTHQRRGPCCVVVREQGVALSSLWD